MPRKGFTLVEILIVITVIAVLAVTVILVLNPAELVRQARDANRSSDLATITTAINIFVTDRGGSLGSSSVTYLSLPDPTATTSAGTNCSGLGFSASGGYHCPASSTYRLMDGTGWIPVNLNAISSGAPISSWPVDPINSSSSGYYYSYATDGKTFEIVATPESQKQAAKGSQMTGGTSNSLILPTVSFGYTGSVANWTVPAGVTSLTITAKGAGGAASAYAGGAGGLSVGTLSVTPGTTFYINVGGTNGYDGGGAGTSAGNGGGMTWFSSGSTFKALTVIMVAGGGGGGGNGAGAAHTGGNGGDLTGANGNGLDAGQGGTQFAGGAGAVDCGNGGTGSLGAGGDGDSSNNGAGGGGGYYGGGGGTSNCSSFVGSGGGGSSYLRGTLTATSTTAGGGASSGSDGSLTIGYQ